MDSFIKSIKLSFDVDKQNVAQVKALLDSIQKDAKFDFSVDVANVDTMRDLVELIEQQMNASKQFKDFESAVTAGYISEETAANLQAQIDQLHAIEDEIDSTRELIEELSKLQDDSSKKTIEDLKKYIDKLKEAREEITGQTEEPDESGGGFEGIGFKSGSLAESIRKGGKVGVAAWGAQRLMQIGQAFLDGLKNVMSDAMEEMKDVLTYSQLTDAQVREQAFTYGFSQSENYAFSQTMDLMGFSSFEDLYYMNSQQQAKFQEKFLEYQERYAELYDSGYFTDMQDFQWEMQEFKEDMTYEVMTWMMDNKETLMNLMEVVTELAMFTIEALGWIVDYFGTQSERSDSARRAETIDIINNNSVSTNSTNVKIDNTFNNVDNKDRTWLANAGEMTYEQIIKALE